MKYIKNHIRSITVIIVFIIILFPFIHNVFDSLLAQPADEEGPFLVFPDTSIHKECVKDTEYMRFHHWELLHKVREDVVRHGKRGDIGISKCADCHTSREQFCNKCHEATSLKPDCFGCHYYP